MSYDLDLRCPNRTRRLFAKLGPGYVEASCQDCRKSIRVEQPDVQHVLHRYSVLSGRLLETVIERAS
ncbi:hypothetical protein GCM10017691_24070 [Pseudonocardia petroleophila]|uniref:Uncharacterized protein n=1 Tax=Pseudonocardia petroleophila TaxID=37331 RepID=A0A7G7MFT7_9PSEU|nr:hypothetical protein [Pseudonocardia petroleophila]QNG51648.1 hypothetical protein H6H00_26670 [Pseudonocardia petroleophila]